MLANVPVDTPYLLAVLEPPTPALQHRLYGQLPARFERLVQRARAERAKGGQQAWIAAVLELAELWQGSDPTHWFDAVGLDPGARVVLYGISIWPVLRLGVRDPRKLRAAIERVARAAEIPLAEQTIAGHRIWIVQGRVSVVAAVLDREVVLAFVPGDGVEPSVRRIFERPPPGKSLAETRTVPELLARHAYLSTMLGYVDTRRLIEALLAPGPLGATKAASELGSPACKADLDRVTAFVPRVAFGYHRLDDTGFSGSFVIETAPWFAKAVARLRTDVPPVPLTGQALLAIGGAFDLDAADELAHQLAAQSKAHPFQCEPLAAIDEGLAKLGEIGQVPAMLHGLRGFGLVVEDASPSPPSGTGQLLVVGTQVTSTVAQMLPALPVRIHVTADGTPAAVPLDWLGAPAIKSAHLAMRGDRVALAVGPQSEQRVVRALDAQASMRTPLLSLSYDLPRIRARFASLLEDDTDLADLGNAAVTLDVRDDGLVLEATGTWGAPPQLIPSPNGR